MRKVKKRTSNGTEMKTNACVITFGCDELPERVQMCGVSYRIRKFNPSPLICGKCLKLGHIKANCKAMCEICRTCGGEKQTFHECTVKKNCPNCPDDDNDHIPNGKECAAADREKLVVHYKVDNGTSYFKAREAVAEILQNDTTVNPWNRKVEEPKLMSQVEVGACESLETEIQQKTQELERARKLRQDLEKLNVQLKLEYEAIERLRMENAELTDKIHKASSLKRPASPDSETNTDKLQKVGHSVSSLKKQPPQGCGQLSHQEVENIYNNLDQKNKNKFHSITQKALNKSMEIHWYQVDEEMIPVEEAISNPGIF